MRTSLELGADVVVPIVFRKRSTTRTSRPKAAGSVTRPRTIGADLDHGVHSASRSAAARCASGSCFPVPRSDRVERLFLSGEDLTPSSWARASRSIWIYDDE